MRPEAVAPPGDPCRMTTLSVSAPIATRSVKVGSTMPGARVAVAAFFCVQLNRSGLICASESTPSKRVMLEAEVSKGRDTTT